MRKRDDDTTPCATTFDCAIGIDYSGAQTATSRLGGLQVYLTEGGPPERVAVPAPHADPDRNWTRTEVAKWLIGLARDGVRFVAGLDHGFGFPQDYLGRYGLESWDEFLIDFAQHWPTHEPGVTVDMIRAQNPARIGDSKELRLCERWTSSAKSVFRFDVQGQVAKSTHTGIPWLLQIRQQAGDRVHFWPYDGWRAPEGKSLIAETYPSIFRNRYPREDRTIDEQDAYSVARWLRETCDAGFLPRYLDPPLTDADRRLAEVEGWILGIL